MDLNSHKSITDSWKQLMEIYQSEGVSEEDRRVELQPFYQEGIELAIGIVRDKILGHFIMVGWGGIHIELLDDVEFVPSPTSNLSIEEALSRLTVDKLLRGFRGGKPVKRQHLVSQIKQLDRIVSDYPQIEELDINPLYITSDGQFVVLDSRMSIS